MVVFLTLVRRELGGYFGSMIGYVVVASVLFLLGLGFSQLLLALSESPSDIPLTELFYRTMYFWIILLLVSPAITMRSFSMEKATGTYESLMTAPVTDLQVVMAKFCGAMILYLAVWLPLLGCLGLVRFFTGDDLNLSGGIVAGTYLGITLLGCLYVSLGCFASSLTKNQIIAAMLSFAMGIALFICGFFAYNASPSNSWMDPLFTQVSMLDHMESFVRGVVDMRYVTYYVSLTVFFLYLNCKVVESRRWK